MKPIYYVLISAFSLFIGTASATAILHCPPDQTLPCTAQSNNLMAYGDAYVMKNGVKYDAGLANVVKNLNSCNVGTVTRKWQVEDVNGQIQQCTQTLTFLAGNFGISNITWPEATLDLEGCEADIDPANLPEPYQEPFYYHDPCNMIGMNYKDEVYHFGPDCKKIIRKWTILDWCTYIPGTGQGEFTFHQTFKLSNDSDPVLNCPGKTTVVAKQCERSFVSLPLVTAEGETCSGDYVITNTSIYADTTSNDASGTYPVGEYEFSYLVDFACGLQKNCLTQVTVIEPNPVPYCLATVNIVLMGVDTDNDGAVDDGMVDIWAKDVDHNSYHPCHNEPLNFSFEKDSLVMSRTFTCEQSGRNSVNIYVSDHQGKQSYCRVDIVVQNNGANIPNCHPTPGNRSLISGYAVHPNGEPIEGVYISHKDMNVTESASARGINTYTVVNKQTTSALGTYESDDITMHRTYEVTAYKSGDVSTMDEADVAILESYIKGETRFKNTYTYLAADLNDDGTVDVQDFHLMNNLKNADEAAWPNQMQWAFYTALSLEFGDRDKHGMISSNSLAKYIMIQDLDWGWGEDLNFIGIRKGDLDFYENMELPE